MTTVSQLLDRLLPAPSIDSDLESVVASLRRPNFCLAAPVWSELPGIALFTEPVERPVAVIWARLQEYMSAGQRAGQTEIRYQNAELGAADFVERTRVFRFPDLISVRLQPSHAIAGATDILLLSRSVYGHSDWGVNRKRVRGMLRQLSAH